MLRSYQLDGLNWILRCYYQRRSCILADEMGLGKTVQVVTTGAPLPAGGLPGPFLVVVPLSTIEHWAREFAAWTEMNVCVYHDPDASRGKRLARSLHVRVYYPGHARAHCGGGGGGEAAYGASSADGDGGGSGHRPMIKFHCLVTTYEVLIKDYEELSAIPWRVVVVDEAHRLRTDGNKLTGCLKEILTKGEEEYEGFQLRLLMTGTPLQNNTGELWSLLNFIEPTKFPSMEKFEERFGNIRSQEQVRNLQRRLEPHLLRRIKEDVATDIPAKEEVIIDVELTTLQKQYYRAIFEKNRAFLTTGGGGAACPASQLPRRWGLERPGKPPDHAGAAAADKHQMELRCCNHPFLVAGVEDEQMRRLERRLGPDLAYDQRVDRERVSQVRMPHSSGVSAFFGIPLFLTSLQMIHVSIFLLFLLFLFYCIAFPGRGDVQR